MLLMSKNTVASVWPPVNRYLKFVLWWYEYKQSAEFPLSAETLQLSTGYAIEMNLNEVKFDAWFHFSPWANVGHLESCEIYEMMIME